MYYTYCYFWFDDCVIYYDYNICYDYVVVCQQLVIQIVLFCYDYVIVIFDYDYVVVCQRLVKTTEVEKEVPRPTQTSTLQAAPTARDRKADPGKKKATSKVVFTQESSTLSQYSESCL